MLKLIRELNDQPHSIWGKIEKRILADSSHIQWYCRYTEGELKKAAQFLDEYGMSFTPEQYDTFFSRFNDCEKILLQQLNSTTDTERLEKIETRIKSSVQRTSRMIQSHALDIEAEMEINALVTEKQSKRTKPKTPIQEEWQKISQIFL